MDTKNLVSGAPAGESSTFDMARQCVHICSTILEIGVTIIGAHRDIGLLTS